MPERRDLANAVRFLSMDAIQKANSGHPGMPMGMADIAEVLWRDFLRHNPTNPHWVNRDRFILSNGHGCMLQYALLHLTGYDLTLEDLKAFRQLHSKTPGHPEWGVTPGVETTTGPLGQGLANGVGMAVAEKHLAAEFNREGFSLVDHYTYVFAGDGCLMEGISHEVCSLAGTLGLNKLIVFYDDNGISIDGPVQSWFTDDTVKRFEAYHWQVISVDGHDSVAVKRAIEVACASQNKPTLIRCTTTIGWGSPNLAGKADTHGAALGEQEIAAVRAHLHWSDPPFVIPQEIYTAWDARSRGKKLEEQWQALFAAYEEAHPSLAQEFRRRMARRLPDQMRADSAALLSEMTQKKEPMATRKASQMALNHYSKTFPELFGGSADLTESNSAQWKGAALFTQNTPNGRYLHYGVREFGMSAMMNGMALYGGIIPYGGTFLTFSDYARNAVRLAALMKLHIIFLYSHDSIGLGEDGPTHQPVEHLPSLRLIPHLSVWRPCDAVETAMSWHVALLHDGPVCLLVSRQNLPFQERGKTALSCIHRGGYILWENQTHPELIFIATGSEVALAMEAAKQLDAEKRAVRVVSMPSVDIFLTQEASYQESVLPRGVTKRIVIEAAASAGWYQFVGTEGKIIGIDRFGASAPAKEVFRDCGFTVEHIVHVAREVCKIAG